ncbi:ABC transporter ATP-binding protein [Methanobacterium formicicum]|jgi:iron complex transport system ATP-binding protein|uniref:Putative ABC transporter ATP-binding protein MJ0089 n=1 Tax=Methanobacterium formicicum TaxID=2162 RepID=A0A090JVT4_METFO|nr:ABC transporter ATP-binding protein [Methanobacterium formicicum]MDH2659335.1 ABC transporter ATP-binding protein [Methanobacterium formicicum]CEA13606.1 putative ABC transporter ATP-binding protein MJ0089 [Methanobacterium formicicum]
MVLSVNKVEFSYGNVPVLRDVNFEVQKGDFISILGVNGSGKSTLMKCINRILSFKDGIILVEDRDLKEMKNIEIAQKIGYVPQNSETGYITVFDAVLLGRKPYIKWDVSRGDIELTEKVLKVMGLEDYSLRYINELSGGELQKVVIARALVQEPQILLLDEPTSDLDLKNQLEVMKIIKDVSSTRKIASVVVMHDINLALRYSDKFIILKDGQVFTTGGKEVITPEIIKETYGVDVHVTNYEGIPVVIPKRDGD